VRLRNLFIMVLALATLTGCSTLSALFAPPAKPNNLPISSEQRQQQLNQIRAFDAEGAISITVNGKTDIGSFQWHQRGSHYTLSASGPMNIASWTIQGRPGKVTLDKGKNNILTADSPEDLMQRELGWSMPLSNFTFWSRGMMAPDITADKTERDQFGHLRILRQQGWQVRYVDYTSAAGQDLPRSMIFTNRHARIKLVVRRWQISQG
jgi:outer membrane lipoprotein LolB